ncbi:hypothetical protein [Aegicerativicinus sediminis]|uniref:hypothetical protein n=1 Tax=Aegicerativicinus sediminis TaxID=2893202 RepID=UPI001E354D19|nr:hypothetical protein [Aegicerativicinus sediminis]
MLKRVLFLIPLIFCSCYKTERNCEDYKTGTFKFTYSIDGKEETSVFKRTADLNIDYLEQGNDTASIKWINACEFIQRAKSPKSRAEEQAIHFKIISTTDTSYTFEYKLAIKPENKPLRTERGTAYKIVDID